MLGGVPSVEAAHARLAVQLPDRPHPSATYSGCHGQYTAPVVVSWFRSTMTNLHGTTMSVSFSQAA